MRTVLVLLKYAQPGKVKTRLAACCGAKRATTLYREWIGLILARLQPLRGLTAVVGYFDGAAKDKFAPWSSLVDDWWPQPKGDLGKRLAAGFEAAHARRGPVVAIGTDCLDLDALLLPDAFEVLAQKQAVFGPAADGGYYLVGTSRHLPGFFQGIPWSTSRTLAAHLSSCEENGWSVGMLPAWRDIDTCDDWLRYCRGERESR
jgi:rSAM/selenodomain-associated transferase 1